MRRPPIQLLMSQILLNRTNNTDEQKLAQLKAGYYGELRVDREWKEMRIKGEWLHDFTCENEFQHPHQIDTVFICQHFLLVLEIKNITGQLDFDDQRRQFIRTRLDGTKEAFTNPVDQLRRHRDLIAHWSLNWPQIPPIESAIIIANPHTIIGRLSKETPIFNVIGLPAFVKELMEKHRHISCNVPTIKKQLLEKFNPTIRERLKQPVETIKTGVICSGCKQVMTHTGKGFYCISCASFDRRYTNVKRALLDYRTLYGQLITTKQFAQFTHIHNLSTANKLLHRLQLQSIGKTKGMQFIIPERFSTGESMYDVF